MPDADHYRREAMRYFDLANHAVDATQAAEFRRIASDMMQLAAGAASGQQQQQVQPDDGDEGPPTS
jgi:hypothetical protein